VALTFASLIVAGLSRGEASPVGCLQLEQHLPLADSNHHQSPLGDASPLPFIALVFLLGVGSGICATGTLTLMVDFTTPERAGLLMGAWTVAHQLAEAVGNVLGGLVLDGTYALSRSYVVAFGAVFALEVVAALAGLLLLRAIDVRHFQKRPLSASHPPGGDHPDLEANKLVASGIYRWSGNPQMGCWGLVPPGIALIGRSALALMLVALFTTS